MLAQTPEPGVKLVRVCQCRGADMRPRGSVCAAVVARCRVPWNFFFIHAPQICVAVNSARGESNRLRAGASVAGELCEGHRAPRAVLAIAKEVGDRAGKRRAYGNLGTCHMHLNEYVKAAAYFKAQHALAISLKLAHLQSDAALNMGVASPFRSGQIARALLLALTKLLDRIVTRRHWRA